MRLRVWTLYSVILASWTAEVSPATAQLISPPIGSHEHEFRADSSPQTTVRGHVVDEDGLPVKGSHVRAISFLEDASPTTLTDSDGHFELNLPIHTVDNVLLRAADASQQRIALRQLSESRDGFVVPTRTHQVELTLRRAREFIALVTQQNDDPVADAAVGVSSAYRKIAESRTDASGRALLRVPPDALLDYIWAVKPGAGLDYFAFQLDDEDAHNAELLRQTNEGPIRLVLAGTRSMTLRVMDADTDEPLGGANVTPWHVYLPGKGAEFNLRHIREFNRQTDSDGIAALDYFPRAHDAEIPFWVRAPGYVAHELFIFSPSQGIAEYTIRLRRMIVMEGQVLGDDRGPLAGATVAVAGDGYNYGQFRASTVCDQEGNFRLELSPEHYYSIIAQKEQHVSDVKHLTLRERQSLEKLELELQTATRVFGRVTGGPAMQPLANRPLRLCQRPSQAYSSLPASEQLANPHNSRDHIEPILERLTFTNADGRFEFFVGPGRYYLVGPTSAPIPRFTIDKAEPYEINLAAHDLDEPEAGE